MAAEVFGPGVKTVATSFGERIGHWIKSWGFKEGPLVGGGGGLRVSECNTPGAITSEAFGIGGPTGPSFRAWSLLPASWDEFWAATGEAAEFQTRGFFGMEQSGNKRKMKTGEAPTSGNYDATGYSKNSGSSSVKPLGGTAQLIIAGVNAVPPPSTPATPTAAVIQQGLKAPAAASTILAGLKR